ncbi:MAG: two-component sensor histidine kinase [Marmoricola sp.]|nr:two-component sensor histidine kinase [Marmoricola sp.]
MSLWQRVVGTRPIVTRLVLKVALAMALVLLLASGFVFWRVQFALDRQLDQDLAAWRGIAVPAVRAGAVPPLDTPGQTVQVYDARGRLVGGNLALRPLLTPAQVREARAAGSLRLDRGRFLPAPAHRGFRVEADAVPTPDGPRVVASAISRSKHDEALRELLLQLLIADLATLAAASLVGYRTARAALDPVERYRRAAARAGTDDTEGLVRLPVAQDRDDELSRLGHTFNDLLARIEAGADRERQFLADASHELRTPLALMSTELQWVRHRTRSAEETATVLASLQGQVDRLVGLSDALLELEELRSGGGLRREPVVLRELVADAARDSVPPGTDVVLDVPDLVVSLDRRWCAIALGNLLVNAVRHGTTPVTVSAAYDAPRLRLVVRDSGAGFPEDFREVAFDRFRRAEQSRTTPGSGLGLHLVRSVALGHGGDAEILPGPGGAVALDLQAPPADRLSR